MTPPLGSRELDTFDAPPTMRADLFKDEARALCPVCERLTVWEFVEVNGKLFAYCTEHTQAE